MSTRNKRISLMVSLEPMAVGRAHLSSVEGFMLDSMLKHVNYMIDSVAGIVLRDIETSIEFHRVLEELVAHRGALLLTKKRLAEDQAAARKGLAEVAGVIDALRLRVNHNILSAAQTDEDVEDGGRDALQIEGFGIN
jgi:hypothetical protein